MKKTLVIGLDAACWEYLDPVIARGEMPVLEDLQRTGLSGRIQSTLPAHTPTAWGSIITGKNPGKHGVYDHITPKGDSYAFHPTGSAHRRGTPFWRRLNEAGLRVGLVNVPFTHPPEPIDGFALCGFGAPESSDRLTYPRNLLSRIRSQFNGYAPGVQAEVLRAADPDSIYRAEREHQKKLVRIATSLAGDEMVDVLVMNLMLLDHANHKMPSMDLVERALSDSDEDVGWVLDQFQPDNVLLFSDHGSRRLRGAFHLDAWLRDRGYCVQEPRTPRERVAAVNWILVQWGRARKGWADGDGKLQRWAASHILGLAPERITRPVWRRLEAHVPFAREHARFRPELDYQRSALYFGGTFSGLLYFNRKVRGAAEASSNGALQELAQELSQELRRIEDPNRGLPLFTGVHRPSEIYHGTAVSEAPDIILDMYDASCNVATNYSRGPKVAARNDRYYLEDTVEFGHHSKTGMFVFTGAPFKQGHVAHEPVVTDLAPLVLSLYGIPIPEDFDGVTPEDLLRPEFLLQQPISFQAGDPQMEAEQGESYSEREAAEVLEHLRALGYLD